MIRATVSPQSCFFSLYRVSPSSAAKNIISPCVESSLVLLEESVCYDQCVHLPEFCYPLLPYFILYTKANFVSPGISWLPTFAFQSSIMKMPSFMGITSRRSYRSLWTCSASTSLALVGGAKTWIIVACLENKQRSVSGFWDCTQVLHLGFFHWLWGLLHFF